MLPARGRAETGAELSSVCRRQALPATDKPVTRVIETAWFANDRGDMILKRCKNRFECGQRQFAWGYARG